MGIKITPRQRVKEKKFTAKNNEAKGEVPAAARPREFHSLRPEVLVIKELLRRQPYHLTSGSGGESMESKGLRS